jgi:hypothetical protein
MNVSIVTSSIIIKSTGRIYAAPFVKLPILQRKLPVSLHQFRGETINGELYFPDTEQQQYL